MITSVFMSSTSQDLREHRAAVREALLTAGYHPVDMADFMARAEGATSACLKEVAESDLFIGIYAWRYGFIPPEAEVSITEQEFHEARQLDKPCFCFLIDETYEWPAQFKESGPGAELLQKFKAYIDANLVRTTFTTPDNLARKVLSTLNRWEKEQHKLTLDEATQLLSGVASIEEAQAIIANVLETREIEYEVDQSGYFNISHGTTTLTVEVFVHERLGLMVDFRAGLATEVDIQKMPAEVAADLLALNWSAPMGGVALEAASGTLWYDYRLPAGMLTEETAFACMSFVVTTADSLDEEVAALLPTRSKRRSKPASR